MEVEMKKMNVSVDLPIYSLFSTFETANFAAILFLIKLGFSEAAPLEFPSQACNMSRTLVCVKE